MQFGEKIYENNKKQKHNIDYIYILFNFLSYFFDKRKEGANTEEISEPKKQSGFWATVIKVELTDIAFAIDSILAAVAIAITLPHISETSIGGINLGQFAVMVIGGFVGVIIMRYAANIFIKVLETKPGLEIAAFLIVGWVGIKLFVIAAAHEKLALIPHEFPHSTLWTVIFWVVLLVLLVWGVLVSKKFEEK